MALLQEQQVHNLIWFVQDRVQPETGLIAEDGSTGATLTPAYRSLAPLETFLWCHLGIELNYFPMVETRRFVYEYFPYFLRSYENALEANLIQLLPSRSQAVLDSELNGRMQLFSNVDDLLERGDSEETLTNVISSMLILENQFATDATVANVIDLIAFRRMKRTQPESSSMNESPNDWLTSGVIKMVQYMEASKHAASGFDASINGDSVSVLKGRIREIQAWRLNFGDKEISDNFLVLVNELDSRSRHLANLETRGVRFLDKQLLVLMVRALMIDWGLPPLSLEAGT